MVTVGEPRIDTRPEKPYLGIRTRTPMKGMFRVIDGFRKELGTWFTERGIPSSGPPFMRYHVIDMAGEMDVSYGIPVAEPHPGDDRVTADILPAGRYASLIYVGGGMTGNKTLINWARENGIEWDKWEDERGDAFRCRCETYLTDPKVEHRKSRWKVEVAIKIADAAT